MSETATLVRNMTRHYRCPQSSPILQACLPNHACYEVTVDILPSPIFPNATKTHTYNECHPRRLSKRMMASSTRPRIGFPVPRVRKNGDVDRGTELERFFQAQTLRL